MHGGEEILVLPNAWDPASARVFAAAGAKAVGTTSMGIAASLGFPDEQVIPADTMLAAVGRIVRAVDVPVTADLEAGYGDTIEDILSVVHGAIRTGVVGMNIEDGTGDPRAPLLDAETFAERITAIRDFVAAEGVPLVINARTDSFLAEVGTREDRYAAAVDRGNRYRAAGADCIFVPGGLHPSEIQGLVTDIDAPINVVANPAVSIPVVPSIAELKELGVARVSVGSGALRTILAVTQTIARELLVEGHYETMASILGQPDARTAYDTAIGKRDE